MGKVRKRYNSVPLWLALFLMIAAALLIAALGTHFTSTLAREKADEIQSRYITATYDTTQGDVQYSYDFDFHFEDYTAEDMRLYRFSRFIENYAALFWYSVCIASAAIVFYMTKLKKPLRILQNASHRISENELDFTVKYPGSDEMSALCEAFETMRSALEENNDKMLHMLDERKQLNDAYTHDLRTPIAVLKGYTDMLIGYLPTGKFSEDEILETVQTMSSHVERLEQFADSMNTVQKLEDIDIQKEQVPTEEFLSHLRETADFLCQSQDIAFEFESSLARATILIDPSAVTQVFENLLNNALRFAEEKITILCLANDNIFSIAVTDDGKGFSEKELITAAKPYYSGQAEKGQFHFGLGLHICRTLCEKHGGTLRLENTEPHGAKVTASFYISPLSI